MRVWLWWENSVEDNVSVVTQMQICIFPVLSKAGKPVGANISRGLGWLLPCGQLASLSGAASKKSKLGLYTGWSDRVLAKSYWASDVHISSIMNIYSFYARFKSFCSNS